ncbi:MAG: ureidoglycolate lyase [Acidimicrobiales bacterium]
MTSPTTVAVPIQPLSADGFTPFGTVIAPTPDGAPFGPGDAVLQLGNGTPRFYAMTIPGRGFRVAAITRHLAVTQVLASVGGHEWVLVVAPPVDLDDPAAAPTVEAVAAFVIPGDVAVKLHVGTWHAGPLFEGPDRSFFNLELADTNVVDHHTVDLAERHGVTLELVTP